MYDDVGNLSHIVRELEKENKQKKRIGNNIFKRLATRRGGVKGGVVFPSDLGSTKKKCKKQVECSECSERKNCTKNGGVKVFMLNTVLGMTWSDFLKLGVEKRKEVWLKMIEEAGDRNRLAERLGISRSSVDKMHSYLGYAKRGNHKAENVTTELLINDKKESEIVKYLTIEETNQFRVSLAGIYKGEDIRKRIEDLICILYDDKEYSVYLSVEEKS